MIRDRTEELARLHAERIALQDGPAANGHGSAPALRSDAEVLELCRKAANAPKFERLFDRGDLSGYGGDESRTDQALVSMMAFYTQYPDQLDRLFRGSALCREKWTGRPDYRRRTIEKALSSLTETYTGGSGISVALGSKTGGERNDSSSQRPAPIGVGTVGRRPEVVRLVGVERPGERRYVVEGLVPAGYATLWHGDGGVAKSMLALSMGTAVAGDSGTWLGRAVEHGAVLYADFELEAEEQARRVWQLCKGAEVAAPPAELFYASAVGHGTREALAACLEACKEHSITLLIVDSLGPALQGDAEAARDVIGFYRTVMDPFRVLGVAVLIIDHQAKLQAGESYQRKGAFGSVYKANLARSVVQAEATERGAGTLSLRIRQKKHNFGPLADPFGVKLSFSEEAVGLEAVDLDPEELAEEATLTAPERVKLVLRNGPLYPSEIAERTDIPAKTVKNSLTGLRKQGSVEGTGEKEGREERVRLIVPTSQSLKGDGTRDDARTSRDTPVSLDLEPGQSATVAELSVRGDVKAAGAEMRRSKSGPAKALKTYLDKPTTERLEWLTKAVLTARRMDPANWRESAAAVKTAAEDPKNHPLDCDCAGCP